MKKILLSLMLVTVGAIVLMSSDSNWDRDRHLALDTESALVLAKREVQRTARKRSEFGSNDEIVGQSCLVSRFESELNKHYVFEFRRANLSPAVISVVVDSGPHQLDYEVTSNAPKRPDGTPTWSSPIKNCGAVDIKR